MPQCTAFIGTRRIASGPVADVALAAKRVADRGDNVLIFDDATAQTIEIDFRGSAADVSARLAQRVDLRAAPTQEAEAPRGPGRPKLGVVAREVTLLPRDWDWLAGQPGGASVALRKRVEIESGGINPSATPHPERASDCAMFGGSFHARSRSRQPSGPPRPRT